MDLPEALATSLGIGAEEARQHFPYIYCRGLLYTNQVIGAIIEGGQFKHGWPHHKPRRLRRDERTLADHILHAGKTILVSKRNPPGESVRVSLEFLAQDFERFLAVAARVRGERRWEIHLAGDVERVFRNAGYPVPKVGSEIMLGYSRFMGEVAALVQARAIDWLPVYSDDVGLMSPRRIIECGRELLKYRLR